jgi:hypothetical protein
MSEVIASVSTRGNSIECVLSASDCYIETLSIQTIDAQPGLLELVIKTQLLSAKNPAEKRVKSKTIIHLAELVGMKSAIDRFLKMSQALAVSPPVLKTAPDAQIQPIRGIKKDQIALSQATKQRQCGTFVIRQGLEKMTPREREEFFKSLERDGFLPEV